MKKLTRDANKASALEIARNYARLLAELELEKQRQAAIDEASEYDPEKTPVPRPYPRVGRITGLAEPIYKAYEGVAGCGRGPVTYPIGVYVTR